MLVERRKQSARFVSGGQPPILAIGGALTADPRVLRRDELSFGLAPSTVRILLSVLASPRTHGTLILLAKRSALKVLELSERRILLRNVHVVILRPAAELVESDAVWSGYSGKSMTSLSSGSP